MNLEEKIMYLYEDVLGPEEERKIVLLLKYVVIDNDLDLRRIKKEIRITEEFIQKNINNDSVMLKYLTQNELRKFRLKMDFLQEKNKKLIKLIKLVLLENETNLGKITKSVPITSETIKKYAESRTNFSRYLNESESEIFAAKLNTILGLEKKQREEFEFKAVASIIDEILNSRRLYKDICRDNFLPSKAFEKFFNNKEYMEKHFPAGTFEIVKAKIDKNREIRMKKPRDFFVVEDRVCVKIAKDDIYCLNQFDNRRLNFAAYYLGTGANLELTVKHFETNLKEALITLADPKLKDILKPEYYEQLQQCLNIDNLMLGNNLIQKKQMALEVVEFLNQNNYDIDLATKYFKIPHPLFNKILCEVIRLPYIDEKTKVNIKDILNIETNKKLK